jgi:hypothetical protein
MTKIEMVSRKISSSTMRTFQEAFSGLKHLPRSSRSIPEAHLFFNISFYIEVGKI